MSPRIGTILPPAAAPIGFSDIARGLAAMSRGEKAAIAFADTLREHFQVKYCGLLSSGKAALALILRALHELYPDRDEVLIPAFTCYSVPAAIFRVGLKIRICDVEPATLDFDYTDLVKHLTAPRLLCVIPTHLFGVTADISRLRTMIGNRNLPVVEDAAQAMGGERSGCKAGTMGDVGFFSLERGKAFSTVRGGIVVTNSETIGAAVKRQVEALPERSLAEQLVPALYAIAIAVFSRPWLYWIPRSLPFLGLGETVFAPDFAINRLTAFQAGMATDWQARLRENIRQRAWNSDYLTKLGIQASCSQEALRSGLLRYPVLTADHGEKMALLHKSDRLGLGCADVYPGTVETIAALGDSLVGGTSHKARSIVARMLTLPVHPYVSLSHLNKIANLFGKPAGVGETGEYTAWRSGIR